MFAIRKLRRSGYEKAITQRLGRYGADLPAEPRCWIHAVSVGEAVTSVPLVEALARRWPELGIVMTTVTPTGARIVADRLDGRVSHRYFPVDLPDPSAAAEYRPALLHRHGDRAGPNFLRALAARGIPSGRQRAHLGPSFRRYRRVRFLRPACSATSPSSPCNRRRTPAASSRSAPRPKGRRHGQSQDGPRSSEAGAETLWRRLLGLGEDDLVWIAGSTHRGEDAAVLDAFARLRARFPQLVLLLAPRHPERVPEVERLVSERGLKAVRRSDLPGARDRSAVIILDTVGELAQIYRVATVVFVGGSLVPTGGHNMLEPALLRKAVLFGPHTSNFRESADALLAAGGAALVEEGAQLERHVGLLLGDADLRRRMGEAAFHTVVGRQGAVKHTLELVERYLMEPARG